MKQKRGENHFSPESLSIWEKSAVFLVAILVLVSSEVADILVFTSKAVISSNYLLWTWVSLQAVISFTVCWFADKGSRERFFLWMLLVVALFGFVLKLLPSTRIFAAEAIGVSLYPTPLVMAILLDIFPRASSLRIIAAVIFVEFTPWAFVSKIKTYSEQDLVFYIVLTLFISFSIGFLGMRRIVGRSKKSLLISGAGSKLDTEEKALLSSFASHRGKSLKKIAFLLPLIPICFALLCGETGFDVVWYSFSYHPEFQNLLTPITAATLIGILIACKVKRLPHISMLTITFFGIGGGGLSLLLGSAFTGIFLSSLIILALGVMVLSTFGGIYLPFAGDAIIGMSGTDHRARGAAIFDIFRSLAPCIASIATSWRPSPAATLTAFSVLFLFGGILLSLNAKK